MHSKVARYIIKINSMKPLENFDTNLSMLKFNKKKTPIDPEISTLNICLKKFHNFWQT